MHHAWLQQQQQQQHHGGLPLHPQWGLTHLATRPGPEPPAAVSAGDDEDVGTGIDSGAVSKGTSGTVTIWSSPRRLTPDCNPPPPNRSG